MSRRLFTLVIGLCPWSAGCFLPWAVPAYSRCPGAVTVTDADDEVVAIFVRAAQEHHGTAPMPAELHTLRQATVAGGQVPSHSRVYLARGHLLYLVLNADWVASREYCLTKLYRRGYQTVVIEPGLGPASVHWAAADTPADREHAIRDLIYRVRTQPDWGHYEPALSAGSADLRHREVLLFAAGEYEWVAELYLPDLEARARCLREAQCLRSRAAE
jgi:hypothetical protein